MESFSSFIREVVSFCGREDDVSGRFLERLSEGGPSRDENPESHFCVYFPAFDPETGRVFMGHHKKSGLWLFNGGHLDAGELPDESLRREIDEEWGLDVKDLRLEQPELLTVTEIDNRPVQTCMEHLDLWYFIRVMESAFRPDMDRVLVEFDEVGWYGTERAVELASDPNTLRAIRHIERVCHVDS